MANIVALVVITAVIIAGLAVVSIPIPKQAQAAACSTHENQQTGSGAGDNSFRSCKSISVSNANTVNLIDHVEHEKNCNSKFCNAP